MKKFYKYLMFIICAFIIFGCSCTFEQKISKEEAIDIIKNINDTNNVTITTTTETTIDGDKSYSTQVDTYYEDKYYHLSDINGISTKTWYGEIDNVLYAFYYTKNANNEEAKSSSRIENSLLEATKKQPISVITNLFDSEGNLSENYNISGSKKGKTFTIVINNQLENESDFYTITIEDNKILKVIKSSNIDNNVIKITSDYTYNVEDITLPTLNEYPLSVNG